MLLGLRPQYNATRELAERHAATGENTLHHSQAPEAEANQDGRKSLSNKESLDQLPISIQRLICNLRKDVSLYRIQRNEARQDADSLGRLVAELQTQNARQRGALEARA